MSQNIAEENFDEPKPSLPMAVLPIVLTLLLMAIQLIFFEAFIPHIPLSLGIAMTAVLARLQGHRWESMEKGLFRVVQLGLPSVAILMTVGMIIGTWMLSGTVPLMI